MSDNSRRAKETGSMNKIILPAVFIRDVSGSMAGEPIEEENMALEAFFEEGRKNSITASRTHVGIVKFNDKATIEREIMPMDQGDTSFDSSASGCTNLDEAVMLGLKMLDENRESNGKMGRPEGNSLLIICSDGLPTSPIDRSVKEVQRRLAELDDNGLKTLMVMSIFIDSNENSDRDREEAIATLSRYSGGVITANYHQYKEVFDFIHNSIKAIHQSGGTTKVNVPMPPNGLKYVTLN